MKQIQHHSTSEFNTTLLYDVKQNCKVNSTLLLSHLRIKEKVRVAKHSTGWPNIQHHVELLNGNVETFL